jgi:hypothetical protein
MSAGRGKKLHLATFGFTHGLKLRCCLLWATYASLSLVFSFPAAHGSGPVPVAGWTERARLSPGDIVVEAKLDTAARTSSLHAVNPRQFERDGKNWVAFDVLGNDGRSVHFERPVVRISHVKSALGRDEARPTVTLGICIGSVYRVTEVNLADRSSLIKPLLIGRRFLKGRLRVDPDHRNLLEPVCDRKGAQ